MTVPSITGLDAPACPSTNAVVAIWVVLVSAAAVGAAGVPVKVGEPIGAGVIHVWADTLVEPGPPVPVGTAKIIA